MLIKLGFEKRAKGISVSQISLKAPTAPTNKLSLQPYKVKAEGFKRQLNSLSNSPQVRKLTKIKDMVTTRQLPLYKNRGTNINLQVPKDTQKGT
tara:strand:+ start:550 stop:831 length:282 start_codon:yes stop_codon:yes gene_type:complete